MVFTPEIDWPLDFTPELSFVLIFFPLSGSSKFEVLFTKSGSNPDVRNNYKSKSVFCSCQIFLTSMIEFLDFTCYIFVNVHG
ncbi:hypothetical protein GYH30_025975 [Glycine max]|nr:hypothetical protein GYH30_025975 [Glycine max]